MEALTSLGNYYKNGDKISSNEMWKLLLMWVQIGYSRLYLYI